jgi:aryl-alcohol dehydrogenase-like predicted oxidoreductase
MERRTLGTSGISVSALSLGSWLTYEAMPEADARAVIEAGLAAGINFLDDARYDDKTGTQPLKTGYSEVLFGRLLRQIGVSRASLVIGNKLWFEFFPGESIEGEIDGSLGRLEMDYLDIEYCVPPPDSLPMAEMIAALDRVIASGKLRAWGVLNWPAETLEEAVRVAKANGLRGPSAAQVAYSALTRSPVEDERMGRVCKDCGIAVVSSYSLAGGLLSGKYRNADGATLGRLAAELADPRVAALLPKVDGFVGVANGLGCTPSQLAIAYCLKNPLVTSVLFGARRVAQVRENVAALDVLPRVTEPIMAALRAL